MARLITIVLGYDSKEYMPIRSVGWTRSPETLERFNLISHGVFYYIVSPREVENLPRSHLLQFLGVEEWPGADKAMRLLKKKKGPYLKKISVLRCLDVLFTDPNASYTRDQLLTSIYGSTWTTIQTALSDLNKEGVCPTTPKHIKKVEGKYVRR